MTHEVQLYLETLPNLTVKLAIAKNVVLHFRLQELTNVPFRCVDEINQGMDEKNELAVWTILFESAERNPSQVSY